MDNSRQQPHEMSSVTALAQARRLEHDIRHRARWYVQFLIIFGTGVLIVTPLWGLVSSGLGSGALNAAWIAFVIGTTIYVRRQPVAGRGMGQRYLLVMLAWAIVYAAVLVPGFLIFSHNPAWWVPGGLAASAPFFAAAYLEHRR